MSGKYTVEQFTKAIEGSGGIVSAIAKAVGCSWVTAKRYIDAHPTVLSAWQAERERISDKAESNIITAIVKDSDLSMSVWWLKVMRNNEFGDKRAVDVTSGGKPLKTYTIVSPDDWPDKE